MTSTRPIVIDDTDARVVYSGQDWFQDNGSQDQYGDYGSTHMHTLHGTNTNGRTSFKLLGTNNLTKIGDKFDPFWDCYVDKLKIETNTPSTVRRNNFPLCEADQLSSGEHQITLNITTHGQTFWFDSIQYVPRVEDSYDSADIIINNTDPAVELGPGWAQLADTNLTLIHGTNVRLNFTGTSLSLISLVSWGPPHNATTGSYSIDGGNPVTFSIPGLPAGATSTLLYQTTFTTPQLTPTPHSILVTYLGDGGHAPLDIDYFLVTNSTISQNPTSSSSTTTGTAGPQATGSSAPSLGKKTMVGPIVGGVVGGIVLLAVVATLIFFLVKKKRKRANRKSIISDRSPDIMPFMSALGGDGRLILRAKDNPYTASAAATSSHQLYPHQQDSSAISDQSSTSNWTGVGSGPLLPLRKGQEAREGGQLEPEIVHHQDSGERMQPQRRPMVDIPPTYTET